MADRVLDGPLRTVGLAIPALKVFVTSSPGDDAVQAVRQARADAAVVWSRPQEHRDLDGVVLGSVLFGIVLPLGHALADRAEIPVAALGSESAVMFPWSPFAGIWQRTVDHLLPGERSRGRSSSSRTSSTVPRRCCVRSQRGPASPRRSSGSPSA
jgi:hypothetical protein